MLKEHLSKLALQTATWIHWRTLLSGLAISFACGSLAAQQPESEAADDPLQDVLAGHSIHGDAFNEGPRQEAYLMGGTGQVEFPVTTKSELAQQLINQGIGQLHGFWYLEAERSFRQAAAVDPDCAMAYWGASMAAYADRDRARGFIEKAVERKSDITEREKQYIDSLVAYFADDKKSKEDRAAQLLKDLETIVIDHPDDLEAKAFVAHRIWYNSREGIPVASHLAADALMQEIFRENPLHPAHHYMIHLWDYRKPERALKSAALCGPSAPSIAHMWHMPGHIYSRLKRYQDAVYQQEASARVDHAHMMRDQVMPDEINNFAHNNEWLIRNLIFLGQANRAVDLAKNMVELPRHPKYNTLEKRGGSASYGRRRLLQALREFEMYEQAVTLCQTAWLEEPDDEQESIKTLRLLACSAAMTGRQKLAHQCREQLQQQLETRQLDQKQLAARVKRLERVLDDDPDLPPFPRKPAIDPKKAKVNLATAKKELAAAKARVKDLEKAILAADGYAAAARQEFQAAYQKIEKATGEDVSLIAEWQFRSGEVDEGIKRLKDQVKRRPQESIPLARLAFAHYQNGDTEESHKVFQQLRDASSTLDLEIPLFARLAPIAGELSLESDWRKPVSTASDVGYRPALDSLGPFRWSPPSAPQWQLKDSMGLTTGSSEYAGRPHIVIFYLGHGCLHCAEQLQAFAPRVDKFRDAGIELVAISTDDENNLLKSIEDAGGEELGIRLTSNGDLSVFKRFRAYDNFENQPLHGTFLIDAQGKIRWQDISYEPFMDHAFLLKEAQRLLADEQEKVGP